MSYISVYLQEEPIHYNTKNFKIPMNVFNKKCSRYILSKEYNLVLNDTENTEKQKSITHTWCRLFNMVKTSNSFEWIYKFNVIIVIKIPMGLFMYLDSKVYLEKKFIKWKKSKKNQRGKCLLLVYLWFLILAIILWIVQFYFNSNS